MKPLSKNRRLSYVIFLIFTFVIIAPLLIMYASGYRLDDALNIATTGGLYLSAPQSGAEIYLENKLVKKTSIFQKSIFVQNLKPSIYSILIKKDGYQDWKKTLEVFPETVTEAYSFMFPTNIVTTEIQQKISQQVANNGTTTGVTNKTVENPEYADIVKLFSDEKPSLITQKVGTSTNIKEFRKLLVKNIAGTLRISWNGELDSKPAYFCQNEVCKDEIIIKPQTRLKNFDFFPGRDDLIIMSTEDGIYVSEIDDRSAQNIQKLFGGIDPDFRIKDGDKIFFKQNKKYYMVSI